MNLTYQKYRHIVAFVFIVCILVFNNAKGIWGICQDMSSKGNGNVSYSAYLTLPLYLQSQARDSAIYYNADSKYRTYGGYIQYGISKNFDVGLHGNSSVNSSVGLNLKYQATNNWAVILGCDYVINELMLSPFGTMIGGYELSRNFSIYGGAKVFRWPNMYLQTNTKRDILAAQLFSGVHIYSKSGWKNQRLASFLPGGLYVELGHPLNVDKQVLTITLGLDGFLGISFPRLIW